MNSICIDTSECKIENGSGMRSEMIPSAKEIRLSIAWHIRLSESICFMKNRSVRMSYVPSIQNLY